MRKWLSLPVLPFAFLFVAFMRWNPWYLIRIGEIWSNRIGHLIGNTEAYLSERDNGFHPENSYDIWFNIGKPCNKVVAGKYASLLHMWPAWFCIMVIKVNCLFRGWEKNLVKPAQVERDIYNLWKKPHIGFTASEEKNGRLLLENLGISGKWVCLIVRDSSYLAAKFKGDFSYHNYRDAELEPYAAAVLGLVQRGYTVVRMGEIVQRPFPLKHSKVIDYAGSEYQCNFGDLYLGAKCEFCIGTPTGFMMIPQAFQRPLVMTDFVPIEYFTTSVKGLIIWKHHVKDGKRLSIQEIVDAGVSMSLQTGEFQRAGVTLENNSSSEIYDVAMEMCDLLDVNVCCQDQSEFWNHYPRSYANGKPLHGEIKVRIGREFLNARLQDNRASGHQGAEPHQRVAV